MKKSVGKIDISQEQNIKRIAELENEVSQLTEQLDACTIFCDGLKEKYINIDKAIEWLNHFFGDNHIAIEEQDGEHKGEYVSMSVDDFIDLFEKAMLKGKKGAK